MGLGGGWGGSGRSGHLRRGSNGLRSSEVRSNGLRLGNYCFTRPRHLIGINLYVVKMLHRRTVRVYARAPSRNLNCACELRAISQLKLPRGSQGIIRRHWTSNEGLRTASQSGRPWLVLVSGEGVNVPSTMRFSYGGAARLAGDPGFVACTGTSSRERHGGVSGWVFPGRRRMLTRHRERFIRVLSRTSSHR